MTHQVRPPASTQTCNSRAGRGHPAPPCRCGEQAHPRWGMHFEAQGQPHMARHARELQRGRGSCVERGGRHGRAGPAPGPHGGGTGPRPGPPLPAPFTAWGSAAPGARRLARAHAHRRVPPWLTIRQRVPPPPARTRASPPQSGRLMAHYFAAASPALGGAVERRAGPAQESGAAATGEAGRGRSGALPAGYST